MLSKKVMIKVILGGLIAIPFFISCKENKSISENDTILDSIEIYKKYQDTDFHTDLRQSRIVYYFKSIDTLDYMNTGRVISFYNSDLYRHEYLVEDNRGFTLNSILSLNDDILNFKSGLLLNKDSVVVDTLLNSDAKIILYLDGVRINRLDSINMNKSIPFKPLEMPR